MVIEKRHVESIASLVNQSKAILFVGEGASAGAQLKRSVSLGGEEIQQFVRFNDLARMLCKEMFLPETSLEKAGERFEHRRGRIALNSLLINLFRDLETKSRHHRITRLGFKLIYTTNYDTLLERAFQQEFGFYPVVVARNTDVALVRERQTIIKLHGDIAQMDTLIITETDFADYPRDRKALFDILRADLYAHSFVFLGYGLRDDSLRILYRSMVSILGRFVNLSYAILPPDEFDAEEEGIWRDKYKIQLLGSDIDSFIEQLSSATIQARQKNISEERKRRIENARQQFVTVTNHYDRPILTYLGSSQDLEDLSPRLRNEYMDRKGLFAYVDFKTTGPFKGCVGLFKHVLEALSHTLKNSCQDYSEEDSNHKLDFAEYERKAQSAKYRYLYLHYGERADLMLQGEEPIPDQEVINEIGEETFVQAAMQDFNNLLKCITEKAGWQPIVMFLDRLDMVEQFLPTLQHELLEQVINTNRNVLFVISYASAEPPNWESYAFENCHVQYHELAPAVLTKTVTEA